MKTWTLKVILMTASALVLMACSKSKGNSTAAVPPATGLCVVDANGACAGQTPFTGSGSWKGMVTVTPAQAELFRQFMMENQLCGYYYGCVPSSFAYITIRAEYGGRGTVTIRPYVNGGYSNQRYSRNVNVTTTNAVAGFNMIVPQFGAYQQAQVYPPQLAAQNSLQLSAVFAGGYGQIVTVTLYFRGVPVASGQLNGRRTDYSGVQPGVNSYSQAPAIAPYYR